MVIKEINKIYLVLHSICTNFANDRKPECGRVKIFYWKDSTSLTSEHCAEKDVTKRCLLLSNLANLNKCKKISQWTSMWDDYIRILLWFRYYPDVG